MKRMRSMGEELKSLIPRNHLERQAKIQQKMEQHEEVQRIKREFPKSSNGLTHPTNFRDLSQHLTCFDNCKNCPGLSACANQHQGHTSIVSVDPDKPSQLNFRLQKCDLLKGQEKQKAINSMIKSHHIPKNILNATFDDIEPDPQRTSAILAAIRFCSDFKLGETTEGLYLYGNMGVGKSKIVGAIAQEFAKNGIDVLMVYVPDFLSEIKDAISSNSVEAKLDALREASVLILDDIGAETLSIWTRDEVLGPILQRRMERLPTIYTSNLTMRELEQHLVNVKDFKNEDRRQHEKKAARIIERIEPFVQVLPVGGRNRRRD